MPEQHSAVADLVAAAMGDLSPSEKRIARALMSDYPSAGLSTVSALAAMSSTSAATVVRFCHHLGFDGFVGLQARLRHELTSQHASPASRAHKDWATSGEGSGVQLGLELRAELVSLVQTTVPSAEVDNAIAMMADPSRTLMFCGGKFSHLAARYLQLQLRHIRAHSYFLADPLHLDVGYLLDARKNDVLVVMDFRRYESTAMTVAQMAKARGCVVILFTDVWLSPVAQVADIVIPVTVDASPFDSLTGLFAVVESLVPGITKKVGPRALERMDAVEETRNARDRATEALSPVTPRN